LRDLTRQYRPKDWESIIGQDHLVKTLTNEIKADAVGHAYLFCGPRGTGKTTTGRVFAGYLDAHVIELDAASNNGVENIRNLRDDVLFLPTDGKKYKVYIIDEVHMLTAGAFNAFLKTLEEPPNHVIFILATTDPQKIPTTILSRCQRFDLRRITVADIVSRLAYICESESIKIEEEVSRDVLEYIARSVDGGMRDAIKLLQKCTSLDETISVQTVVDALGSVNEVHLETMESLLLNKDVANVIINFNELILNGIDVKVFLADLVDYIKEKVTAKLIKNDFDVSTRMSIIDELLSVLAGLKNATQVKTLAEIALIKMCHLQAVTSSPPSEEKTVAQQKKEVNQAMDALPIDSEALKQIAGRLTTLDKKMVITELDLDQMKKDMFNLRKQG